MSTYCRDIQEQRTSAYHQSMEGSISTATEIWLPVPGYQGTYVISNMGRVKSLPRATIQPSTGKPSQAREKIIRPYVSCQTVCVRLSENGKQRKFSLPRLVFKTFCGQIPDGYLVAHSDEDFSNCRAGNLVLRTQSEIMLSVYARRKSDRTRNDIEWRTRGNGSRRPQTLYAP